MKADIPPGPDAHKDIQDIMWNTKIENDTLKQKASQLQM